MRLVFLDSDPSKDSKFAFIIAELNEGRLRKIKTIEIKKGDNTIQKLLDVDKELTDKFKLVGYNIPSDKRFLLTEIKTITVQTERAKLEKTNIQKLKSSKIYRAINSKSTDSLEEIDAYRRIMSIMNKDDKLMNQYREFCIEELHLIGEIESDGTYRYLCKQNQETVGLFYKIYSKENRQKHTALSDADDLYKLFKKVGTSHLLVEEADLERFMSKMVVKKDEAQKRGLLSSLVPYKNGEIVCPPIHYGDIPLKVKNQIDEFYKGHVKPNRFDEQYIKKVVNSKDNILELSNNYLKAVGITVTERVKTETHSKTTATIKETDVKERIDIINSIMTLSSIAESEIAKIAKDVDDLISTSRGKPLGMLAGYENAINAIKKKDYKSSIIELRKKLLLVDFLKQNLKTKEYVEVISDDTKLIVAFIILSVPLANRKQYIADFVRETCKSKDSTLEPRLLKIIEKAVQEGGDRIRHIVKNFKRHSKFTKSPKFSKIKSPLQSQQEQDYISKRVLYLASMYNDRKNRSVKDKRNTYDTYISRCYIIATLELSLIKKGTFQPKQYNRTHETELGEVVSAGIDCYLYARDTFANGQFYYLNPSYKEYNSLLLGFKRPNGIQFYIYKSFTQQNVIDLLLRMYTNDSLGYAVWQVLRTGEFKKSKGKGRYKKYEKMDQSSILASIAQIKRINTEYKKTISVLTDFHKAEDWSLLDLIE